MAYIVQLVGEMIRQNAWVLELKKSTVEDEMKLLEIQMKKMIL